MRRKKTVAGSFVLAALTATLLMVFCSCDIVDTRDDAERIHFDSIVVDTHNDTMMFVITDEEWLPYLCLNQDLTGITRHGHIDIPKLLEGGIDVPFCAAWTTERRYPGRVLDRTLALMNALYWQVDQNPDIMQLAMSHDEIIEIVESGKIAPVLTIEGAYAIRQPYGKELLCQFDDLGVRVIGLTWNYSNELAEGAHTVACDYTLPPPGLTEYGEEIVKEMNRLGIVVDVSHLHFSSFWDVIEVTEAPVIATHSSVYSLKVAERNLKDDQIEALAENGGVMQITFVERFLGEEGKVDVGTIVDHIEYVIDLVGVDYVGIGSDFDGTSPLPEGMPDASAFPRITEELVRRGHSAEDIEKILGLNTLRVLKEAEEVGAAMRAAEGVVEGEAGFTIRHDLEMGEIIDEDTPLLTAALEYEDNIDPEDAVFRVILDGEVYTPEFDPGTDRLSFQVAEPLAKGFHVLTFEAASNEGVERAVVIFHRRH